jgi:hypothetical protein
MIYVGLYRECLLYGQIGIRCDELTYGLYKSFIDSGVSFNLIGMLMLFVLLVLNLCSDSSVNQDWNVNGFLIATSGLIFTLGAIIETVGVVLFFSNKPERIEKHKMKLDLSSTSFCYFTFFLLLNNLLISLIFYTLSFLNNVSEVTKKKKMKIKERCLREVNVIDMKAAPQSTPSQF